MAHPTNNEQGPIAKPNRFTPSIAWVRILLIIQVLLLNQSTVPAQNSVVVWGGGSVTNVPANVTNVATVAAGSDFCVAVLRDGRLRMWGNYTNVPGAATNVVAVSCGVAGAFLALRLDGSVINENGTVLMTNGVAIAQYGNSNGNRGVLRSEGIFRNVGFSSQYWPANNTSNGVALTRSSSYGSLRLLLADGRVVTASSDLSAAFTNVVSMSDGGPLVCTRSDGTVAASGVAASVPAGLSNVVAVASGSSHAVALQRDGNVVAWGSNSFGETNVPGTLSQVAAIAAGAKHSLALRHDRTVVAWGANENGQTNVPAALTNVAAVFAGATYSVAIVGPSAPTLLAQLPDVNVWSGRPSTFTTAAVGTPPLSYQWNFNGQPIPNATNWFYRCEQTMVLNAGLYSVTVSNSSGTVTSRVARLNVTDQPPLFTSQPLSSTVYATDNVTLGAAVDGSSPLSLQWFFNGSAVNLANQPALALTNVSLQQAGQYWMVASNAFGVRTSSVATLTIWEPQPTFQSHPTNQAQWWGMWTEFSATARGKNGVSYQWQRNGQSLAGATTSKLIVADLNSTHAGDYWCVASNTFGVSTSSVATLSVLLTSGGITMWGRGGEGQNSLPPTVSTVAAISAGGNWSMALLPNGRVSAWGESSWQQTNVPSAVSNITAIAAGYQHGLALRADGKVFAWGNGYYGQTVVPYEATNVVGIAAGEYHSLALREDGTLLAWGANHSGQIDVPVGLSNVIAIAAGQAHNLALKRDGTVVAWGSGNYGERNVPVGLSDVVSVAGGQFSSYALRSDGTVVAWGFTVPSGLSNVIALAVTTTSTRGLALHADSSVSSWDGGSLNSTPPGISNVVAVAVGLQHSMVLLRSSLAAPAFSATITRGTDNTFSISAPTVRGKSYYWEYKDATAAPRWLLRQPLPGNGAVKTLVLSNSPTHRLFRVWQKP